MLTAANFDAIYFIENAIYYLNIIKLNYQNSEWHKIRICIFRNMRKIEKHAQERPSKGEKIHKI